MENKADNVVVEDLTVKYKGSRSLSRSSLFRSVDNGIFCLAYENNTWSLSYRINMRQLFIGTSILSIIMGGFALATGGPCWIGIVMFLWLCVPIGLLIWLGTEV